jgi:hypothetical protein
MKVGYCNGFGTYLKYCHTYASFASTMLLHSYTMYSKTKIFISILTNSFISPTNWDLLKLDCISLIYYIMFVSCLISITRHDICNKFCSTWYQVNAW